MFLLKTLLSFLLFNTLSSFHVQNRRIIDEWGREVIYHGVNVVFKLKPWHPSLVQFNYNTSFNNQDYEILQDLGLNFVRLGVMWPGVEPQKGIYNYTYLNLMKSIVQNLEKKNISVLIEFHQDSLSEYYCGEGIPDWAVNISEFPFPLSKPYNKSGKPSRAQCLSKDWWKYQFSLAASKKYQELYSNTSLRKSFFKYWELVANTFNTSHNVIGYEIMNEPWPGNIYNDPFLLIPGEANVKNLQGFYDDIFNYLNNRNYLKNKLFLFESITWSNWGSHFKSPCRNNTNSNQCVLSYHCYVPPNLNVDQVFRTRLKDQEDLNSGGFLTEVGSNQLDEVFKKADESFQSVGVWSYKINAGITGDGSMFFNRNGTNASTRLLLNRSYPRAICGHGKFFNFNVTTNEFVLIYENNVDCKRDSEIYINKKMNITIIPEIEYFIENNILYIKKNNFSGEIIIRII